MSLILLVALTILSGLALIIGSAWAMILLRSKNLSSGKVERGMTNEEHNIEGQFVYSTPAYAGKTKPGGKRTGLNFAEIKEAVKKGQWRKTLPLLLAIFGFLGLLLFGSLALFVVMDDKVVGSVVAAVAIFAVIRVIIRMIQA